MKEEFLRRKQRKQSQELGKENREKCGTNTNLSGGKQKKKNDFNFTRRNVKGIKMEIERLIAKLIKLLDLMQSMKCKNK